VPVQTWSDLAQWSLAALNFVPRNAQSRGPALSITIYGIKNCDTMEERRAPGSMATGVAYDFSRLQGRRYCERGNSSNGATRSVWGNAC